MLKSQTLTLKIPSLLTYQRDLNAAGTSGEIPDPCRYPGHGLRVCISSRDSLVSNTTGALGVGARLLLPRRQPNSATAAVLSALVCRIDLML